MQLQADQVYATLGPITFGAVDAYGVDWSLTDFDGWAATKPTLSFTQKPRQSGAWAGDSFSGSRSLSMGGLIIAPDAGSLRDAIDRLNAAVSLGPQLLTVTEASSSRWLYVQQSDDVLVTWLMPTIAQWSVQVASSDWRKFGQAMSGSTTLPSTTGGLSINGTTYMWTGTANLSSSVMDTNGVTRTNLFPAPNFESGVSPWTTGSAFTATQSSTRAHEGTYSMLLTRNTATAGNGYANLNLTGLTVGQTYTMSFWAYGGTGAYALDLTSVSSGATKAFTGAASWQRVSLTFVPSASSVGVYVDDNGNTSPTNNAQLYVDSFLLETGSTVGTYFDGNFPSTGGLNVPFTINAVTNTGQVSLNNPGNENGPVTLRIDGPCVGPIITHVSTGDQLVFSSSLSLNVGEYLLIDMEKRTALANGQSSRAGYITSRGWSQFVPGQNTWAFTAAIYNAASQLTVSATPAWR